MTKSQTPTALGAIDHETTDWLDGEEFYNAMQGYRCAPIDEQREVVAHFENVKRRIRAALAPAAPAPARASVPQPVAWRYRFSPNAEWTITLREPRHTDMDGEEIDPLYLSPADIERMAREAGFWAGDGPDVWQVDTEMLTSTSFAALVEAAAMERAAEIANEYMWRQYGNHYGIAAAIRAAAKEPKP